MNGISAILLAAGAGSRFGGGKLTTILDGKPLITHPLEALRDAPVGETVVVVGANAERLREVCEPYGVRIVENPDWAEGQSTSVRAGLQAMSSAVRAAVVLLGDQPLVTAEAVSKLVEAFEAGAEVAVATYEGKRRNPVLFARSVWPSLVGELSGDEGARSFLRKHPNIVVEVPCDGVGHPADVDTTEDLERIEGMRGLA
ncbi:MAG: nucleotidyltransferase family protein [Actinomycetota bacterium]|nr:nucleotidyltransferase family protein [Actinomycetota bacterium]